MTAIDDTAEKTLLGVFIVLRECFGKQYYLNNDRKYLFIDKYGLKLYYAIENKCFNVHK